MWSLQHATLTLPSLPPHAGITQILTEQLNTPIVAYKITRAAAAPLAPDSGDG